MKMKYNLNRSTAFFIDIFETGMKNCLNVGKQVIDAILDGTF